MSDLVVVAFDNETGALGMRDALISLQKQRLVTLDDAALMVRRLDGKIRVRQAVCLVGVGTMGGAFWGLLIGLLLWMPWLGFSLPAMHGGVGTALGDCGLDHEFVKAVGNAIQPGNSALFLLIREATPEKLMDELKQFNGQILQASLSHEAETKLKEAFGVYED
ncbi:MAG: DUF1269 domain-containing protein [Anaerolineae bacterium]|jgi:uncharacterized membrane protein